MKYVIIHGFQDARSCGAIGADLQEFLLLRPYQVTSLSLTGLVLTVVRSATFMPKIELRIRTWR